MRWLVLVLGVVACSRPPGLPVETAATPAAEAEASGAATEVATAEAGGSAPSYEGLWPADGRLPGSDAPRARVPIEGAPLHGAAEPLVTVVVFSDFECPFCSRLLPSVEQLLRAHPDEVRVAFRHFPLPFHQNARLAHAAAIEAFAQQGDAAFWRMHDRLFANQRALARSDLERYAGELGLDIGELRAALDDGRHYAVIATDIAIGQRAGVRGTPAAFVNGRPVRGAQPFEEFERVYLEEAALAQRAMQAGVPRGHLYAAAMSAASDGPVEPPAPAAAREPTRRDPPSDAVFTVPIGRSAALGPRNALVTIVEFAEMECPFCMRVQPTVEALRERYGSDLRYVWKHNPLPFHPNAMPAAIALEEARAERGDRAFWRMHELMFDSPRELEREHLEGHAREVGLNLGRFRRALDEETHRAAIEEDMALARRLGATGTPTFFVNGVKLVGAQPLERFVELVDARLADARERVAAGTSRRRLYETVIADGIADVEQWRAGSVAPIRIAVPEWAPTRGADNGAITIQVFSDFECPFCARVRPTVDRLLEEYPSQLRIVWRHHPLPSHAHAALAAEAAAEVQAQGGDDAFWAYHDLLFDNQRALERADLERYAEQLGGVDMVRFRNALDDRRQRALVQADVSAVADTGVRIGTPAFLIGGRFIQGAQSFEVFRDAIEAELGDRPEPDR